MINLKNFHYEVFKLERDTAYWQCAVVSCDKLGYSFVIKQYGKGQIPGMNSFLRGGRITVEYAKNNEFGDLISKASTEYTKKLRSGKGYNPQFQFSKDQSVSRLLDGISNGEGDNIPKSLRDLIQKSIGQSDQKVEKVEPVVQKQALSNSTELSWLADFWGVSA